LYRIAFILVTVLAIALGLVIGTLNPESVSLDLLWVQLEWPLGLVLLAAGALGLLVGLLLAWFFSILPLRARLRKTGGKTAGAGSQGALKNVHD
jgi:putative membrane protein